MPAEVAHRGRVPLTYLDQACRRNALQCLAHGRAGHSEQVGQTALAGQRLTRLHLSAEDLGDDLVEDVFGHRTPIHRLQGHKTRMADQRPEVKWSDHFMLTCRVIAPAVSGGHRGEAGREEGDMRDGQSADSSIPRWLRFVLKSDRAGSSWYIGTGFFFAPVLAVLSPWPTLTTALWAVIAVAGLWLGLLGHSDGHRVGDRAAVRARRSPRTTGARSSTTRATTADRGLTRVVDLPVLDAVEPPRPQPLGRWKSV